MNKQKIFNFLLGAGFSKAIANYPLGQEISNQIFDYLLSIRERNKVANDLIEPLRKTQSEYSSGDCPALQDGRIAEAYRKLVFTSTSFFENEIQKIEISKDLKNELLNFHFDQIRKSFNYEVIVGELTSFLYTGNRCKNSYDLNLLEEESKSIFEYIFSVIHKSLSINNHGDLSFNGSANQFISLLKYLLEKDCQINIFDLNHDQLVEDICKNNQELSNHYNDFFENTFDSTSLPSKLNQDDIIGKFNISKVNRINHYKLHGAFTILNDCSANYHTAYKVTKPLPLNFYIKEYLRVVEQTWREYVPMPTILFDSIFKTSNLHRSLYLSFCFNQFAKIDSNLLVIGYGRGDNHINSNILANFGHRLGSIDFKDKQCLGFYQYLDESCLINECMIPFANKNAAFFPYFQVFLAKFNSFKNKKDGTVGR